MSESAPGAQLIELCESAERELVLCAPFAKAGVVGRLLDHVSAGVGLELFTRWRPEEVAAGVSDTDVLGLVEDRGGTALLCDRLHAKYARADSRALVGSANLTAAALGWSAAPNLELQIEARAQDEGLPGFEQALRAESVPATSELAEQIQAAAELLPQPPKPEPLEEAISETEVGDGPWYPSLREPADLYIAYADGPERLSRASARAAAADLAALELPPGLDRDTFEPLVGTRLKQLGLFERLGAFLAEPRRFGEVRDFLARHLKLERDEAEQAWQTMMRWLLHFLPSEYSRQVPSHTEIVVRHASAQSSR